MAKYSFLQSWSISFTVYMSRLLVSDNAVNQYKKAKTSADQAALQQAQMEQKTNLSDLAQSRVRLALLLFEAQGRKNSGVTPSDSAKLLADIDKILAMNLTDVNTLTKAIDIWLNQIRRSLPGAK